ncbi:MAG: 50S ribosomal protein L15 [Rickettsiaceae bacterium]|nr:MAG: 50S ribosomal protein L15 [Rickettsiaceae bacterium]
MKLNTLQNNIGSKKDRKRVGRGIGSGIGKTCGRGTKGQKSRSGVAIKGFEGGQKPMIKRLPKRGFNCPSSTSHQIINLKDIKKLILKLSTDDSFNLTKVLTKKILLDAGLIKNISSSIKLLAKNTDKFEEKISIEVDFYSAKAKEAIQNSGGEFL